MKRTKKEIDQIKLLKRQGKRIGEMAKIMKLPESSIAYHYDNEYRIKKIESSKEYRKKNPERSKQYKEYQKEYHKKKYKEDPEFREKVRTSSREYQRRKYWKEKKA